MVNHIMQKQIQDLDILLDWYLEKPDERTPSYLAFEAVVNALLIFRCKLANQVNFHITVYGELKEAGCHDLFTKIPTGRRPTLDDPFVLFQRLYVADVRAALDGKERREAASIYSEVSKAVAAQEAAEKARREEEEAKGFEWSEHDQWVFNNANEIIDGFIASGAAEEAGRADEAEAELERERAAHRETQEKLDKLSEEHSP